MANGARRSRPPGCSPPTCVSTYLRRLDENEYNSPTRLAKRCEPVIGGVVCRCCRWWIWARLAGLKAASTKAMVRPFRQAAPDQGGKNRGDRGHHHSECVRRRFDRGEIVGFGVLPNGDHHVIVLIPLDRDGGERDGGDTGTGHNPRH